MCCQLETLHTVQCCPVETTWDDVKPMLAPLQGRGDVMSITSKQKRAKNCNIFIKPVSLEERPISYRLTKHHHPNAQVASTVPRHPAGTCCTAAANDSGNAGHSRACGRDGQEPVCVLLLSAEPASSTAPTAPC